MRIMPGAMSGTGTSMIRTSPGTDEHAGLHGVLCHKKFSFVYE